MQPVMIFNTSNKYLDYRFGFPIINQQEHSTPTLMSTKAKTEYPQLSRLIVYVLYDKK